MIRLVVLILMFLSLGSTALAVDSDDFIIRQLIGQDSGPPTTPGTLTATPISTTRIDLSWGASTDDFIFGGYQVFRQIVSTTSTSSIQIATTTLTTFSDTGLTASTSYVYNVIAFDSSFNFSTSSNYATATTLSVPITPPAATSTETSNSTRTEVRLQDLDIEPGLTSALLTWSTNRIARYQLRWGRTQSYELGFVTSQAFQHEHVTLIDGLEPDTIYEYELTAYNSIGESVLLSSDQFRTLSQPDTTAPPNVSNFTARVNGDDMQLSWDNPPADYAYVRIVRNPLFYPTDPNDGYVIYQGSAEAFTDRDVLTTWNRLFYTAFAYDAAGNRSSGAIAFASLTDERTSTPTFSPPGGSTTKPPSDASSVPEVIDEEVPILPPVPLSIAIDDLTIIQDGDEIRPVSDTFLVDTTRPFMVYAPYHLFPEHLKAIQISLFHPVDATISHAYLMRINGDKSGYEALINGLNFSGTIPLRIVVYDFETEQMASAEGSIISTTVEPAVSVVTDIAVAWYWQFWWLWLLLLLLLLLWYIRTFYLRR